MPADELHSDTPAKDEKEEPKKDAADAVKDKSQPGKTDGKSTDEKKPEEKKAEEKKADEKKVPEVKIDFADIGSRLTEESTLPIQSRAAINS